MAELLVENLRKSFDGEPVLRDVDLAIASGEIVCLLGPSGCGKTTLLRIVAGLESADGGSLLLDGADLTRIPVHKRQFGLMFQEFALFPDKNVGENVAFGLRMQGIDRQTIRQRVEESLALVDLSGYEGRTVFALSGGERQRVALARSLAPRPRLLMLDEPLGSLDRTLREGLMGELRRILKEVGVTALYVTHDQQEAFAVADRVAVMNQGRLEQVDRPEAVYGQPATVFVARFLGLTNLLPVSSTEGQQVQTPAGTFTLDADSPGLISGQPVLLIRPEIEQANLGRAGDGGEVAGTLTGVSFRGSAYHLTVRIGGNDGDPAEFNFTVPTRHRGRLSLPAIGEAIELGIDQSQLRLIQNG